MRAMKRRLAAAITVLAMLAAGLAPAHAVAVAGRTAAPGADLCAVGGEYGPGSGAPANERGHACERCPACVGGGASVPSVGGAAPAPIRSATAGRPRAQAAMPHPAAAAPLARGPPPADESPSRAV